MQQGDLHLLQTVPSYHLQAIAKARFIDQSSGFGDELSDPDALDLLELAEYLFNPHACREVLHTLNEPESLVLRELVACGGRANSRDLALYLSFTGTPFTAPPLQPYDKGSVMPPPSMGLSGLPTGPSLYPPPHPHGVFEQALHHLLVLGLLFWGKQTNFVGRDYANGVYDGVLIVPPTITEIVRQQWVMLEEAQEPLISRNDEMLVEGMYTFQRALYLYWSLAAGARDGLPLVSSHLLSRAALRQVIEHLAPLGKFLQGLPLDQVHIESEALVLLFLRLLLMKLGLLEERQGAIHAKPAKDFFVLPLSIRTWRCFRLWLETPFWNELAFLSDVVLRPGPSPLEAAHEEVVHSRQVVVEYVRQERPEIWHLLPGFVAHMKLRAPYLLFPRQYGARAERYSLGSNPYGWDFRLRRGWLTHREGWHMVEGGFIRAILNGPLVWLGAVESGGEAHPNSFHLTPGMALLTNPTMPELADPPWGRLVVQPNFDLVALAPVAESLLLDLDRFAERVRLEHIAQYHLSKASVTRAVQQGLTSEAIRQILEQAAGSVLPQNVSYSLEEWERQARRIELWRSATLLEVDDPTLLDELLSDPEAGTWLLRRLTPTLAEVATQHLARLQELLWQRDYLPALTSALLHQDLLNGTPLPTHEVQWTLLPDGLFQPCYPLPNLYLATELERVTEADVATGWRRITPASLQKALTSGFALYEIIQFLQNYCTNGVPGSFLIRLKLWGQGYTEPCCLQVETAPLLSLSAQTLQDLLADEEIGPLLDAPVPAEKRLVHVSQENLERILALLKDRGFEVS